MQPNKLISPTRYFRDRYFNDWTTASFVILASGILLRLIYINAPLSSDELASTSIWAQMPFLKIISNYQYANNHIFQTIILSCILKIFGVNHFLLRFPVLFLGILSLILCYATTLRITNSKIIAFGALILLAINRNHIFYSTNARGYIFIMVFAQLSLYYLSILFLNNPNRSFSSPGKSISKKGLFYLWILLFLGTWTIPTFILFEISLFIFFGLHLLLKHRSNLFNIYFPYTQIIFVLLLSFGGFWFQYFIIIPKDMLSIGINNTGAISGMSSASGLFIGTLDQWIYPFTSFRYLFLLFGAIGFLSFIPKKKSLFFLFMSIIFFQIIVLLIVWFAGIISKLPPPRIFYFIQPFFFICASLGAYLAIKGIFQLFHSRLSACIPSWCNINIFFYILFVPIVFFTGKELIFKVYPERKQREPYHKVLHFMNKLQPYDLILTSNKTHVWFYLYGAGEMRKRVENIINKGKLGDIYILEHIDNEGSDIKRINLKGIESYQLLDYAYIYHGGGSIPGELIIPAAMFLPAAHFDNFKFHKIKPEFIQKVYGLESLQDFNQWELSNQNSLYLDRLKINSEVLPSIRFNNSFLIYTKSMSPPDHKSFSLNINLLSSKSSSKSSVFYLNGTLYGNEILATDSWRGNSFVMDHPYGNKIFNRAWNPSIFISNSDQSLSMSIIQARLEKLNSTGYIRGIQSYRLSMNLP